MKTKIFILVCAFMFPNLVFGVQLSEYQKQIIKMAYHYGSEIKFQNQTYGETIASICFQETKAGDKRYQHNGLIVGDKRRNGTYKSLGVMQVQLPAVRDVFRWYPDIMFSYFGRPYYPTDEEIIVALLTDDEFNIQVGSAYFKKLLHVKKSWSKAILAYNRGAGNDGRDPNDYVKKVKHWRKTIVLPLLKEVVDDRTNYKN